MQNRCFILFFGIAVAIAGCQSDYFHKTGMVSVSVDGSNTFPPELVGYWVSDESGWGIHIGSDGLINSIVHPLGHSYVIPGKENEYSLVDNGKGMIIPGEWNVQYSSKTRELIIGIVLDYFSWTKRDQELQGKSRDVLYGTISNDFSSWTATWEVFPDYVVSTESVDQMQLPVDESIVDQGTFVFVRSSDQ